MALLAASKSLPGASRFTARSCCHENHIIKRSNLTIKAMATSQPSQFLSGDTFFLDGFALRQWDDPNYGGTRINFDKKQFVEQVHQLFNESGGRLVDGYAPFCKHIFVPNFVGAKVGALEITDSNRHLLGSGYTRRRPEELAVLSRWFKAKDVEVPEAAYLDLILYSREQLVKEYAAMPSAKGEGVELPNVPWGIISVKAQNEPFETPMQPITMLRNALGREEGGSGVPIDKEAYNKSVEYWEHHATIVAGDRPNGE
mmetsp:Transcript_4367/g.11853  ORF Transcript_4367/g.11853 Transcript_4367/m.11853 type:complete len:257 (+) Transcript_4367:57-827(+)